MYKRLLIARVSIVFISSFALGIVQIEEPFLEQRELARMILDKFKKSSTIAPFTEIARAAQQKKLNILATEVSENHLLPSVHVCVSHIRHSLF